MPTELSDLLAYLQTHFDPSAANLEPLSAGWFSQAYAFHTVEGAYVLRLNAWAVDFQKDAWAAAHLAGPDLPIPALLRLERFDAQRWAAISPRCPGRSADGLDEAARLRLVPALFDALAALRRRPAAGCPGWGLTGGQFEGLFPSWPAYVRSLHNHKFSYSLEDLAGTFFEPELYQAVLAALESLLPLLPAQKWLVHGDFGFHNLIAQGDRLTGVLDWAEARLGDPLADVANLEYWSKGIPYAELWREYAARRGILEPNFEARLRCYILAAAAGDLRLAAHRGDAADYQWAKARAAALL